MRYFNFFSWVIFCVLFFAFYFQRLRDKFEAFETAFNGTVEEIFERFSTVDGEMNSLAQTTERYSGYVARNVSILTANLTNTDHRQHAMIRATRKIFKV